VSLLPARGPFSLSPSCAKIFCARPLIRGPTWTSSTSIVPETMLRRSPQLVVKIDKAISALSQRYLSIFVCTLEIDAMKVDFGTFRERLHC